MGQRSNWVDYCKAIGIFLVVFGHVLSGLVNAGFEMNQTYFTLIYSVIYTFHMPLFFFLSGLFFYSSLQKYHVGGLINQKIDTLFYIYVFWSLFQGSIEVVLSQFTTNGITFREVFQLFTEPRMQFWFLYALIYIFIISLAAYKFMSVKYTPILFIFTAALYVFAAQLPQGFNLYLVYQNLVFFVAGIYFNQLNKEPASNNTLLLLSAIAFLMVQYFFHQDHVFSDRGLFSLLTALTSIYFVIQLACLINKHPLQWLLTIGTYSLSIYLIHILVGSGIRILLAKFLHLENFAIHLLLGVAFGIAIPLLFQKIVNDYRINFIFSAPISRLWRTKHHL
ncbi:acyltransferase family protein [Pseudoalteromonas tunicata]|uniref:acyltransferase family protein n=1 Tax=Pseudoalteromonas tunicata TaxID=314281 RepID=UPI00273F2090|nr:acyltransferase [Pseudoalteromonas tunicata]MDP4985705.1 acyltransferase [Pseudoalteromonas tunicata]